MSLLLSALSQTSTSSFLLVVSIFALLMYLVSRVWVGRLPHIAYSPSAWITGIGCSWAVMKNYARLIDFKQDMVREVREIAKRNGQKEPECMQWSIIGSPPFVEVLSARMYKFMIKDEFDTFIKGEPFAAVFDEFLGNGIFATDGELWRSQRKIASHLFSARKLNDYMLVVFNEHAEKLCHILAEQPAGQPIDMQVLFFKYTMDAICQIAFGTSLNSLESAQPNPFGVAFDDIQENSTLRFFSPPWIWRMKRFFNVGTERVYRKNLQLLDEFLYAIVRERRDNASRYTDACDLLSLFMASDPDTNDKQLRDLICNFMLAGRDTTAALLTWFFHYMSMYPQVQQTIRDEILCVFSSSSSNISASHESLNSLVLLEAALLETLRLKPSVPADSKISTKDTVFPDGTPIPANTLVLFSPSVLNVSPTFWGLDCLDFKPERWLTTDETGQQRIKHISAFEFPSFNAGPRLCLGKSMALLEAKTVAVHLLRQFELSTVPNHNPIYRVTVIQCMLHGLPMTVKKL